MALQDGNIIIGTSVDMYGMNTGLKKIQKSFKRLQYALGGAIGVGALYKLGKAALDAASDLQEVQNVVDVTFEDMSYKIEKFSETCIEKFGMSELAAKQTAGSFMAMGRSMGLTNEEASNMAVKLTALTGDFASFYNISQDYARVALSAVYTGETETLKRYGIILTEANLQEYAHTLGIQKKVKAMSASEKLLLRYKYVLEATQFVEGDFIRTQDTWANQMRVLKERWKQFLIVLGNGLITVLTPMLKMLNQLVAALIRFANVMGRVLSRLFGIKWQDLSQQVGSSSASAADGVGDLGDSEDELADATDKANKKLKKQLAGFDELNNITTKDDLDDVTDALDSLRDGLGDDDYLGDLIEGAFEDPLKDWDIGSLFQLGRKLNKWLQDLLDSIDWDAIREKMRSIGQQIADFLNGLIDPNLFYKIGGALAQFLNSILELLDGFAERFDWKQFGESIGAGINGFFDNFDFKLLAETINHWVEGLLDTIIYAIKTVNWENVGKQIMVFLENIDYLGIARRFVQLLWEALKAAIEGYSGFFSENPLIGTLSTLFGTILLFSSNKIKNAAKTVGIFFKSLKTALTMGALDVGAENLSTLQLGILNLVSNIKGAATIASGASGLNKIPTFVNAISDSFTGMQKAVGGAVAGFAEFAVIEQNVKKLYELFSKGPDEIENFGQRVAKAIGVIITALGAASTAFSLLFGIPAGLIITGVIAATAAIVGFVDAINDLQFERFKNNITEALTNPTGIPIEDALGDLANKIRDVGDSFDEVSEKSSNLERCNANIDEVSRHIEQMGDKLDAGILTAEEAVPTLIDLYGQLADAIIQKFQAVDDLLTSTFAEDGLIAYGFEQEGINVSQTRDAFYRMTDTDKKRVQEIKDTLDELKDIDLTVMSEQDAAQVKQQIAELGNELLDLSAKTNEVDESYGLLEMTIKGIDWSSVLDTTDLEASADRVKSALGGVESATKDTYKTMETETSKIMSQLKDQFGNSEQYKAIEEAYPGALRSMKNKATEEIQPTLDVLQYDLVDNVTEILENAEQDWSKMSPLEQALYNWDFDAYGAKVLKDYKSDFVDPINNEIQTTMNNLGIEGKAWASDAMGQILEGLINDPKALGNWSKLKDDYKTSGEAIVQGAIDGAKGKSRQFLDLMGDIGTDAHDDFDKASGVNSPSWLYAKSAMFMLLGGVKGANENARLFINAMKKIGEDALKAFDEALSGSDKSVGKIMSSLSSTMVPNLKKVIQSLSTVMKDVGNKVKEALVSIINFINVDFMQKWNNAWTAAAKNFVTIWNQVPAQIKNIINTIVNYFNTLIQRVNQGISTIVNGLNNFQRNLSNSYSGGNYRISGNSSNIPRLATGAVIPPNAPFMAMLGDQKHGTNIEAPLDTIKQALSETLSGLSLGNNNSSSGDIVVQIDGREVFRAVRNQNDIYRKSTGDSAFI